MRGGDPREHHLEVRRTARYATLGPETDPGEVWFACHGYRQLARRFVRRFQVLADRRILVVAPEGLSRFYLDREEKRHGPEDAVGATWMTREDREVEIRDYVRYLDLLERRVAAGLERPPRRRVVLGFSQGVHTASRWVVLGTAALPDELVLWGAHLPPDLDMERAAERLAGVGLTLVRGTRDPWADAGRAEEEKDRLGEAGIGYREVTFDGAHEVDPETLARIAGDPAAGVRTPPPS